MNQVTDILGAVPELAKTAYVHGVWLWAVTAISVTALVIALALVVHTLLKHEPKRSARP